MSNCKDKNIQSLIDTLNEIISDLQTLDRRVVRYDLEDAKEQAASLSSLINSLINSHPTECKKCLIRHSKINKNGLCKDCVTKNSRCVDCKRLDRLNLTGRCTGCQWKKSGYSSDEGSDE